MKNKQYIFLILVTYLLKFGFKINKLPKKCIVSNLKIFRITF